MRKIFLWIWGKCQANRIKQRVWLLNLEIDHLWWASTWISLTQLNSFTQSINITFSIILYKYSIYYFLLRFIIEKRLNLLPKTIIESISYYQKSHSACNMIILYDFVIIYVPGRQQTSRGTTISYAHETSKHSCMSNVWNVITLY